jgi:hypothetical protein
VDSKTVHVNGDAGEESEAKPKQKKRTGPRVKRAELHKIPLSLMALSGPDAVGKYLADLEDSARVSFFREMLASCRQQVYMWRAQAAIMNMTLKAIRERFPALGSVPDSKSLNIPVVEWTSTKGPSAPTPYMLFTQEQRAVTPEGDFTAFGNMWADLQKQAKGGDKGAIDHLARLEAKRNEIKERIEQETAGRTFDHLLDVPTISATVAWNPLLDHAHHPFLVREPVSRRRGKSKGELSGADSGEDSDSDTVVATRKKRKTPAGSKRAREASDRDVSADEADKPKKRKSRVSVGFFCACTWPVAATAS